MELHNSFVVGRPVEEAWVVLTDLGRIAPCMPGAQLTGIEGDEYQGLVKVKVGPIVATYTGTATFTSCNEEDGVAIIKASGRDTRQGNADAVITATLRPGGAGTSQVDLATDLSLSGKLASFGKGAIKDVSTNILGQFAANLEAMLAQETAAPSPQPAAAPPAESQPPAPQPLDLAAAARAPMRKLVLPVVVALLLMVSWRCLRRRRR